MHRTNAEVFVYQSEVGHLKPRQKIAYIEERIEEFLDELVWKHGA